RSGDEVWLVGDVGLARAGLLWLSRGEVRASRRGGSTGRAVARCLEAWRRPRALVREGRALRGRARAAIDVSDGLSTDAAHLAAASEVRVVIEEPRLRAALCRELEKVAPLLDCDPLELALAGGEDYALLAVGPGD